MKPFNRVNEADLAFFESILPGRVFSGEAISTDYDHDEMTIYGHYAPEAVLQAQSTEEISAVLRYCNGRNIAVTPRGAGTGLCGGLRGHGRRRGIVHRTDEAGTGGGYAQYDGHGGAGRAADGVSQGAGRNGAVLSPGPR